ncbi:hypothetical protein [Paenibacillus yonginensis]|nr:hypothetical protein [Paenibacillus yonginensis]
MIVINGMASPKSPNRIAGMDNIHATDGELASRPELLRETARFWRHVKLGEAGINQPWFQRLNEHKRRR